MSNEHKLCQLLYFVCFRKPYLGMRHLVTTAYNSLTLHPLTIQDVDGYQCHPLEYPIMSISKFAGGYLFLVAVVVGVNFPATVFYDDGSTGYPVWAILNWFMGLSVIIVLTVSSKNKKLLSVTQADIKKYLEINLSFYGSLMLTIWYFANWFHDWHGSTDLLMWWFITPLFVVITGACGCRMWRGSDGISAAPGTAQSANASPRIRPKGLQRLLQFAGSFNMYMGGWSDCILYSHHFRRRQHRVSCLGHNSTSSWHLALSSHSRQSEEQTSA